MTWGGAAPRMRDAAARDLLTTQRDDGGWAQLPSMSSDAYATGSVLVSLHQAGIRAGDAPYRRGVQFLLGTQLTDGSWLVRTRSHPMQIYSKADSLMGRASSSPPRRRTGRRRR